MDLRMTVVRPRAAGATVEVRVSAEPGTPLHEVAGDLLAATGAPPGLVLRHDGRPLDPASPLGLPPLVEGAVLVADRPGPGAGPPEPAVAELHVLTGPAAGDALPLRPGRAVVGRGDGAQVRLPDPDVSREHLELVVGSETVSVRDLLSANGSTLDGDPLPADRPVPWPAGARVRIGGSELQLHPPPGPLTSLRPDGRGHLLVNRAPQLRPDPDAGLVRYPDPPGPATSTVVPAWTTLLVPLLLAVPAMLIWHQPVLLVLAVAGPVAMGAQYLVDRRRARRAGSRAHADHARAVAEADQRLAAALAHDLVGLHRAQPPPAGIAAIAAGPTIRLWERGATDPPAVRLGVGPAPAGVRAEGGSAPATVRHEQAPVLLDLAAHRAVGLYGDRATVAGLARSVVGRLAVLHAPEDLDIVVPTGPGAGAEWDWAHRLPHRRSPDAADGAGSARAEPGSVQVVVVDRRCAPATPDRRPAGGEPERDRRSVLLCLADEAADLPHTCTAVVRCAPDRAELRTADGTVSFRPEPVAASWARTLARRLAPLRTGPGGDQDGLPGTLGWVPLLRSAGLDPTDPGDLLRRWDRACRSGTPVTTTVGVHPHGRFELDLDRDGPHALVAGTTGSGKSELLLTWVAALAAAAPPDRLQLLLVDYKGGSAFSAVLGLPHVAAQLTDLDPHLAGRALTGLQAELRRRERLLRRYASPDLRSYEDGRAADPDRPPLPRLVVLVDEFRVLAEEVPGFVPGLVRVATVGRSLGIHLVLATQRPGGAVTADIRANVNLRLALRVRDRAESEDVVDCALAAGLDPAAPGRAVARSGPGEPVVFQTARVRGVGPVAARPTVQVLAPAGAPYRPSAPDGAGPGPGAGTRTGGAAGRPATGPTPADDLDRVVAAVREAALRRGLTKARPPWLAPLPDRLAFEELGDDARVGATDGACGCLPTAGLGHPAAVPLGRIDHPGLPSQHRWSWRPGTGSLAVAGGPGSGRSTAVRTLTGAAAVPVYVLDGSGTLADLADLPAVAAVVPATDLERCDRLLERLAGLVRERTTVAAGRAADPLLLVVDGWEQVAQTWAPHRHGTGVDDLLALLRDGPAAGLAAVVTGGRAVLTGAPSAVLGQRLLLPMTDPADEVMAGLPPSWQSRYRVPGRAVLLTGTSNGPDGAEVQLALPPRTGRPATGAAGPHRPPGAAGTVAGVPPVPPFRVPALPTSLPRAGLGPGSGPAAATGGVLVGLGGPEAQPVALPLAPGGGALVAGSPGSGRSTALSSIAQAVRDQGGDAVLVDAWDRDAATTVERHPDACVLVDGPLPLPAELDQALQRHLLQGRARRGPERSGDLGYPGSAVLACEPGQVVSAYAGAVAELRALRTGLLLGALGPGEAEGFGLRLPPRPAGPPGRGLLVVRGRAVPVQVAVPDPEPGSVEGLAEEAGQ